MKFGLILETSESARLGAQARLAEELGFDSVWVLERRSPGPGACPAPLVTAAALAVHTRAVRIGALVILGLSHPLYTAEDAAVLDNISGGRLLLAAAPPSAEEASAWGLSPEGLAQRFGEALEVCLGAWSPLPLHYEGQHFRVPANLPENIYAASFTSVSVTPKPAQVELPLWVVAGDEEAVRQAARLDLPIVGPAEASPAELEARFRLHRSLTPLRPSRPAALIRDIDVRNVDDCIQEIERYRDALGVNYLVCRLAGEGEAWEEAVELFGKAVIPEFRMFGFPAEMRSRSLEEVRP